MMKRKYLLIAAIVLATISCKDILDTTPETSISDASVISDEKSAVAALVGV